MAMEAVGIKSYNTYISTLKDLVKWGFVKMVERSKNQYSSNIIALSKFDKALDKALDKAFIKHTSKQSESTIQSISESIDSINKQLTIKPLNQLNQETKNQLEIFYKKLKIEFEKDNNLKIDNEDDVTISIIKKEIQNEFTWKETICRNMREVKPNFKPDDFDNYLEQFFKQIENDGEETKTIQETKKHFSRWLNIEIKKSNEQSNNKGATDEYRLKVAKKLGIVQS